MAGEIAVDDLGELEVLGAGGNRVGAGADKRQVALEHVEELRQLVDGSLADEASDLGDARIALGDEHLGFRVAHLGIHRAELEDVDDLVVEAVPLLPKDHRSLGIELDGDCRAEHHRPEDGDGRQAEEDVEAALGHRIPVGDRAVENVEKGRGAHIGIGARAEAQAVGVCGEPDVERKHPELLEKLENAILSEAKDKAEKNLGVDISFVGIRKVGVPQSSMDVVLNAMVTQWTNRAGTIVHIALQEADAIRNKAQSDKETALQKARAEASSTLATAQTDALAQFKLMEQDPKLATFLMQLEALEKSVKKQTTLILDDSMGPFGLLRGLDSPLNEEKKLDKDE